MPRVRGAGRPPSQKKPPLTHFLCLPLVTPTSRPELETSIQTFRNHVAPDQPEQTNLATPIHPKAIRPVGVLHCTLGVMSLDEEKLGKAIDLLKSLDVEQLLSEATSTASELPPTESVGDKNPRSSALSPIVIDLKGLASMHTPENTSILYIDPSDTSDRLYPFCLALQKLFRNEGILLPDDRNLKLHATIVNTIYAKGRNSQGHGPNAKAPLKIDARALLEEYKDFVWAENVVLDRIAICEMGAKRRMDDNGNVVGEEYTEVVSVTLPVG